MNKQDIVNTIKQEKIVAILRTKLQSEVASVIDAIISSGIKVLEVTSNTPGYSEEIKKARVSYPETLIGVGTVINIEIAKKALEAGAQFLVTPNTNVEVIKFANNNGVPIMVGALTPTEVCVAHENGADVIKLFPACTAGLAYFKAIKAPLDSFEYFAVGGISPGNATEWFNAGASGIGYGCVKRNSDGDLDVSAIKKAATDFIQIAKNQS